MATLNFDESIVLVLFAQAKKSNPTQAAIVTFDAGLQSTFGTMLHDIMTEEGLEIDVHSRSLVLACRPHMKGDTASLQIRNACRYVLQARQELVATTGAGIVGAAAPSGALAGRASRARKSASRRGRPRARGARTARSARRGSNR
jgi:hypothetical protein